MQGAVSEFRKCVEVLAIAVAAEAAAVFPLPMIAPGVTGLGGAVLAGACSAAVAVPLILWRMRRWQAGLVSSLSQGRRRAEDLAEERAARLHESEGRFRQLADSAPMMMWLSDTLKDRYEFNKGWLEFRGRTLEQEVKNGWCEGVHPEDRAGLGRAIDEAYGARCGFEAAYRLLRHDGVYRWVQSRGVPRFGQGGEFLGYAGGCVDVTERRKVEEALIASEAKLRAIFDSEPECVKLVGPDCKLLEMNPAGLAMLDARSIEQVRGGSVLDLIQPQFREEYQKGVERVFSGGQTRQVYEAVGLAGRRLWIEQYAVGLRDAASGAITQMLAVARDVTARKQAEAEQAAALALTTALSRAADVKEASRALNNLLQQTTGLSRSAVLLYDEDGVCRFVGWLGLSEEYRRSVEGHCPWKQHEVGAEPFVVADVMGDEKYKDYWERCRRECIATVAFVPIITDSGVAGKLMLYGAAPGSIMQAQVRAAASAAAALAAAVSRLRMSAALSKSEGRLRAVIDTALDAVVSMDGRGVVTGWNPQAEATFGWTAEEAIGRTMDELIIPEEQREAHRSGLARYVTTGQRSVLGRRVEAPAVRKDGSRLTVELAITPVRTADGEVFSAFIRDVTEVRRAAAELVEAKQQAEGASRAKSEFLANMSHEIRTPMTAILGYADLLADDGEGGAAQRLEHISTIKRNGEHLLAIINDILDLSKIEAGKLDVEQVAVQPAQVVDEVIALMTVKAQAKGLTLKGIRETAIPGAIASDPVRLRQVLVNLVGNAIKFTEAGGVTLRVGLETRGAKGPVLRFTVTDTGLGINQEQMGRLFRAFEQADTTTTRKFGGTGLGLRISKSLAEILGGDISVSSEVGKGSTFVLTLPARTVQGAGMVQPGAPAKAVVVGAAPLERPLAGVRVLLVEDGVDNQRLMSFHLCRAGAEVHIADNGRTALEMLLGGNMLKAPTTIDLVITDIQMPEMDGYMLTRALREKGWKGPIIALTANAMSGDEEKCLAAGCDAYASKPIDRAKLIEVCRAALRRGGRAEAA